MTSILSLLMKLAIYYQFPDLYFLPCGKQEILSNQINEYNLELFAG